MDQPTAWLVCISFLIFFLQYPLLISSDIVVVYILICSLSVCPFLSIVFIEIQLTYNIVLFLLYRKGNHLYIHIHISTCFQILFPYKSLQYTGQPILIPWAIQQTLISYLFYIQQCMYVNPYLPVYPSLSSLPVTINLFSIPVTLFLFCK